MNDRIKKSRYTKRTFVFILSILLFVQLGHAYNKVLKDILCKFHRMSGRKVVFVPGSDCHGLPIEMRISASASTSLDLIQKCRSFASECASKQIDQIRQLGVVASFDRRFSTMSPQYESGVMEALAEFVSRDLVHRKLRTVPTCLRCQTVLAAAELESRIDSDAQAALVSFPLTMTSSHIIAAKFGVSFLGNSCNVSIEAIVWTSAAWSLPMCRALLLSPKSTYALLELVPNKPRTTSQ